MLLKLPLEIIFSIIDCAPDSDIWTLFNTSKTLRHIVVARLFSTIEVVFESFVPVCLNGKELRADHILNMLEDWSAYIQEMHVSCWECESEVEQLRRLNRMPGFKHICLEAFGVHNDTPKETSYSFTWDSSRLISISGENPDSRIHFPSFGQLQELDIRAACAELLVLPSLPTLKSLYIDFNSRTDLRDDTIALVDLTHLPQLSCLEVACLESDNLILLGSPESLKFLSMVCSVIGARLHSALSNLGKYLEEFKAIYSSFSYDVHPAGPITLDLSHLTSLELKDSVGLLPLLFPRGLSDSLENAIIKIGGQDIYKLAKADSSLLAVFENEDTVRMSKHEGSMSLLRRLLEALSSE